MKHRLLDILKCPECESFPLGVKIFEKEVSEFNGIVNGIRCKSVCSFEASGHKKDCSACYREEISEGIVVCWSCNQCYPIVNGIPRFIPDWYEDFPEFLDKYKEELPKSKSSEKMLTGLEAFRKSQGATKKSFGFQWLRYAVTDKTEDIQDYFSKMGVSPDFLKGKLILDAGCGMGRFLAVASRNDNEVVGIDLSMAVDRAYKVTKSQPFVHVVQGDILKPPFLTDVFSFAYSIGVLHHTPSTKEAFKSVSKLVSKGGRISIWVYQLWVSPELQEKYKRAFSKVQELIFCALRSVTTRLPHKLLHYLCYIAVPLGWAQMNIRKNSALKLLFWPVLLLYVRGHDKWQIRLLDTFDWYAPKYQWKHTYPEVFCWFMEEGFFNIEKCPSPPIGVTAIKS